MVTASELSDLAREARDAWEADAHWWVTRMESHPLGDVFRREHLTRALLDALPDKRDSLLDLGCGDGYLSRLIAERGGEVVGVDWSATMIAAAQAATRDNANAEYVVADAAERLPFASNSFGVVVSSMFAMDVIALDSMLSNAHRVTQPSGVAVWAVLDPVGIELSQPDYFDVERIEPRHVPGSRWSAWVRFANDQPAATLFVDRDEAAYRSAFDRCGWQVESRTELSRADHPRAILFRTRKR